MDPIIAPESEPYSFWLLIPIIVIGVLLFRGIRWWWNERDTISEEGLLFWLLLPIIYPVLSLCELLGLMRPYHYQWHCFISYTTREEEVREVKPFIDAYIGELQNKGITVCPVYYDGWYLRNDSYPAKKLAKHLRKGIKGSAFTVAFLSPEYPGSEWCCYEWTTTEKEHARRGPPAPEHSVLPLVWKQTLQNGDCLETIRRRPWVSVDINDPLSIAVAVKQTLEFDRKWKGRTASGRLPP